jgi:hypothetical protein
LGSGLDCKPDAASVRLLRPRYTLELTRILRMRIVHINQPTFQCSPTSPWLNSLNQTCHNNTSAEHCVGHCPLGHIRKTVDSVHRPKDGNQTLFHGNFLLGALKNLITRPRPDRITGIIEEGSRLIQRDNLLDAARLLSHQCRQK